MHIPQQQTGHPSAHRGECGNWFKNIMNSVSIILSIQYNSSQYNFDGDGERN